MFSSPESWVLDPLRSELAKAIETMNMITAGNSSRFAELWNQRDIGDQIEERTNALRNAREEFVVRSSLSTTDHPTHSNPYRP